MRIQTRPPLSLPVAAVPDRRPVRPVTAVPAAGARPPQPRTEPPRTEPPPDRLPRPVNRVEALYGQHTAEALVEPRFFRIDAYV